MAFEVVKLPNFLEIISKNFELKVNPNLEKFLEHSDDFIKKFGGKYAKQHLTETRAKMFAICCPHASIERLHLIADVVNTDFIFDEMTADLEDVEVVKELGDKILKIMNGEEVNDGNLMCEAFKDITKRAKAIASPDEFEEYNENFKRLVKAQIEEAIRRKAKTFFSYEDFLKARFINGGVAMWLNICTIAEEVKIPKKLLNDENFKIAYDAILNLQWASNDVYSFKNEYNKGCHDMNIIGVLLNEKKISLQEAFDEAGENCMRYINAYISSRQKLLEKFNDNETLRLIEFFDDLTAAIFEWQTTTTRYSSDEERIKGNHVMKIFIKENGFAL